MGASTLFLYDALQLLGFRNSERRSKFLDKPSETSFVVLSFGKSKIKRALFAFPLAYS